jgi:NAD(P)-dependent dehydrogenase (short-subunit alcohol dehydrogenase family)
MTSLANKTALVTGSSRGIGASIATRLAQAGARVALHGRDASPNVWRRRRARSASAPTA